MTDVTKRELEVLLTLQDQMTRELRRVTGEAEKFESKTRRVGRRVRDTFGSIRDMVGKVRGAIRGLINPLTLIGGAVGVGAVTALGRELSSAAANAEELQSKFEAIAGDRAGNLQAWIDELAISVRRGRLEIKQMVSDTTPFLERITGSAEAAEASSKALTQLAIDVGSFYNVADDEVLQRFRSALVGSGEALDVFGARISAAEVEARAAEMGFGALTGELTENEKVITRMAILFERFPQAMGDASRTADSFTNRMKELRGIAADVRAEFGERLNQAILQGLDDAGGVEQVRSLIRVFNATIAEFATAGVRVGAELARTASEVIERYGGADGVIAEIQRRGALLTTQLQLFGLDFRDAVMRLLEGIESIANMLERV
ncbi:MAG: hypothetical protein V2J24_21125, partial [Pseudomonadales bacterium]|nr:hypothetical protein [Pseudomonadales bacterium]